MPRRNPNAQAIQDIVSAVRQHPRIRELVEVTGSGSEPAYKGKLQLGKRTRLAAVQEGVHPAAILISEGSWVPCLLSFADVGVWLTAKYFWKGNWYRTARSMLDWEKRYGYKTRF